MVCHILSRDFPPPKKKVASDLSAIIGRHADGERRCLDRLAKQRRAGRLIYISNKILSLFNSQCVNVSTRQAVKRFRPLTIAIVQHLSEYKWAFEWRCNLQRRAGFSQYNLGDFVLNPLLTQHQRSPRSPTTLKFVNAEPELYCVLPACLTYIPVCPR
jgi:hypothetical protein